MRLAVTGGTGFIGTRLVERLRGEGREVRCLVRRTSRTEELARLGAEPVVVDLVSGEGLERALEGVEAVFHLAGTVRAWSEQAYHSANVEATRGLVRAARRVGVGRVLLVSSLAAAGPSRPGAPRREEEEPRPIVPYGASKLAAERALAEEAGAALEWSVVRPCVVYGPRDREVYELFKLVRRGLGPYAAPPGARVSLVHVDDLVELLIAGLERAPSGRVYFASDGGAYEWSEIVQAIGEALGRAVRPLRVPPLFLAPAAAAVELLRPFTSRPPVFCLQKLREAAQAGWVCSPERARAELGFAPRYSLREGLAHTAAWYLDEGWL